MQPVLDEVEDHNEGSFWNFETDQIQQQEDDAEYAQLKAKMHFDGSVSYSLDFDTNTNEDQSMNHPEMVSFASPAEMEQFLSLLVDESGHPAYTMKWNDEEIHMSGNEYDDQVPHDFYEYQPHYQAGEGQFPMIQVPM